MTAGLSAIQQEYTAQQVAAQGLHRRVLDYSRPEDRHYDFASSPYGVSISLLNHEDSSATARFFGNKDIIERVINSFQQASYDRQGHRELVEVMLGTKLFFYPVTKLLWRSCSETRDLYRLLGILYHIPSGTLLLRGSVGHEYRPEQLKFGPLPPDFVKRVHQSLPWNHFLYYASLIKTARIRSGTLSADYLATISHLIPGGLPVLCSLQKLEWEESILGGDHLLYLLAPSVTRLAISVPHVRGGSLNDESFTRWMVRFCEMLCVLMPCLKSLSIRSYGRQPPSQSATSYFDTLYTLPISVEGIDAHGHRYEVQPRSCIALQEFELASWSESLGLFNSLKTIHWFFTPSLRAIQITSNLRIPLSDAPSILDVIAPILQLQQLRYIDILFTRQAFYFTEGEMLAIAKAFPQLEAIDLNFDAVRPTRTWNEPNRTPPTILGFCTFAALCPNLKHASLPVLEACISRADIPNKMEHPLSNVEFGNLRVMESVGYDGREVAHYHVVQALLRAFPMLTTNHISLGHADWQEAPLFQGAIAQMTLL
ncbi:hypothetical protein ACG7TL_006776 [Trametes sanguinea]